MNEFMLRKITTAKIGGTNKKRKGRTGLNGRRSALGLRVSGKSMKSLMNCMHQRVTGLTS